ncbi:EF-hand calcium-binding domain-containing protein 14 isoform X1 [Megachile rotundata]|uniref:EF-hand calcium-binding domain-containing protein 14 isoform X1 n=1 Tax=Megachile rotundata TaxID=143995 RepID=UPI003FD66C0D
MDSVAVTVPLRQPTKKMKKRKELDALAPPHTVSRRSSGKRSSQELLSDSSDERSEYWNVSTRNGRKCRGRRGRACPGFFKACSAFLACASVLATASLIWLFIDVRQQLTALRTELDQVIAGSEGVPDALQKCHSLSRDLQNNQTIIFNHLSDLKLQINNFTTQLAVIQRDLHRVEEWFKAAPQLANVPKDLKALSSSVVSFGSQIQDLSATVKTLKESNAKVQDVQATMQQNISSIKNTMIELSNVTQRPQIASTNETKIKTDQLNATILHLTNNLLNINETLSTAVQWVAEDQKKDHEKLVLLQETTQNVSMKVISLERECVKNTVLTSVKKLNDQVSEMYTANTEMNKMIKQLEQSYGELKNSTSIMLAAVPNAQSEKLNKESLEKSFVEQITTEPDRDMLVPDNVSVKKSATGKPNRMQ